MKKILVTAKQNPYKNPGGIERYIANLTDALKDEFDITILTTGKDAKIDGKIIETPIVFRLFGIHISLQFILKFRKLCKEVDIVHIHHPDPLSTMALIFTKPKKLVVHWHSDIVRQRVLKIFFMPLQNMLLKKANVVIATSEIYAQNSQDLKGLSEKIKVIPLGIVKPKEDVSFTKTLKKKYENSRVVFALGRLVSYKGFEYLIRAAALLPGNVKVVIGGSGPRKKELERLINELNLKGKVELLGFVEEEKIASYYRITDVFCLPSISKNEAFGVVMLEAFSFGLPVVSTNIKGSGVNFVNEHNKTGIVCNPQDPQGLAEAILKIFENDNLKRKFSENALMRFEQFDMNTSARGVSSVYISQD